MQPILSEEGMVLRERDHDALGPERFASHGFEHQIPAENRKVDSAGVERLRQPSTSAFEAR
jgi:hypothetical protein